MLLAFRNKDRCVFMFGFSKNDRENLEVAEKEIYKKLSKIYLSTSIIELRKMCVNAQLIEV
ncbi:MAG: hypothetical protein DHS20C10_04820 [marine bacterium B5-7]|nr:MAG: hypothetical protein DHS20C10_04820 [marine bacterium B5-7]